MLTVRWPAYAAGAVVAAGIASAAYQAVCEVRDRKRFPPPGQMVDVGGRRLHVLSMGSGSPVIVVVPALGGSTVEMLGFYRDLADETRVCIYDRRGFGWSDPPRRGRREPGEMASDLRQVLAGAGIEPPYLLVAHSLGGVIARQYAALYPEDVAGLVLVESSHEDQARRRQAEGTFEGAWKIRWYALRRRLRILGLRRLLVSAGVGSMRQDLIEDVPEDMAGGALAVRLTARHRRGVVAELMLMTRLRGEPPSLGDLPLTVVTAAGRDSTWMAMQAELAGLSARGTHIVADHGGHYLQQDHPAVVAAAIRNLLREIKSGSN